MDHTLSAVPTHWMHLSSRQRKVVNGLQPNLLVVSKCMCKKSESKNSQIHPHTASIDVVTTDRQGGYDDYRPGNTYISLDDVNISTPGGDLCSLKSRELAKALEKCPEYMKRTRKHSQRGGKNRTARRRGGGPSSFPDHAIPKTDIYVFESDCEY